MAENREKDSLKQLNEDIRTGNFQNLYLIYGEEDYLRLQKKNALMKALGSEEDSMNVSYMEGKQVQETAVIDLAETLPFFADRRSIILENTGFFKNKTEKLADYLEELPDYLTLVFVETEVDGRGRMMKLAKNKGCVVNCQRQTADTLKTWLASLVKKEKKSVHSQDLDYILEKVGTDMSLLSGEMEKLFAYCLDRPVIDREAIDAVCSTSLENRVFDMVEAVSRKKRRQALSYYYDLLALKEAPMRILYLLARQFRIMMELCEAKEQFRDPKLLGEKLGLHPFVVKKTLPLAAGYSPEQLKKIVEDLVQAETDVKQGRLEDRLSVELMIVKYAG